MTRIISTTEKTAKTDSVQIGVDHGKDDHSVEVVGRYLPDGSIEVLSLKRLVPESKGTRSR